MSQSIRLFVGLALPDEVKDVLGETGRSLRNECPPNSIRWVKRDNMHLTLFFLGQTPADKVPAINNAIDVAIKPLKPFTVSLGKSGCFPNPRRPRVFWVGFADGIPALQQVNQALVNHLIPLGWAAEKRPYTPHLTLGYTRKNIKMPPLEGTLPVNGVSWRVTECHLFKSQLSSSGPIYTHLHTSTF